MHRLALTCCAALFAATTLHAQSFTTRPCNDADEGGTISHWLGGSSQACEVRSATLPLVNGHLNVNGLNGGIEVIGEDRHDIALEARVTARAGSKSEAESLLHQITIETGATIQANGPRTIFGNRNWSVSYKLLVPHHLAADLRTTNGGVSLTALSGDIQAETTNGGLKIENLSGDVHVSTTNGGIRANLDGSTWQGSGLSARTTNGGVTVIVPQPYSAHLVASTVNGGTSLSVPNASHSGVSRRSIDTNLGSGGPTLSFGTTNGGISIQ